MILLGACTIGCAEIVGERTTVTMDTFEYGLLVTVRVSQQIWVTSNSRPSKENNYVVWKKVEKIIK